MIEILKRLIVPGPRHEERLEAQLNFLYSLRTFCLQ